MDRPNRRRALAAMAVGGSLYATKETWVKPAIDLVTLPAHAQASQGTINPNLVVSGDSDPPTTIFGAGTHVTDILADADNPFLSLAGTLDPPSDVTVYITANASATAKTNWFPGLADANTATDAYPAYAYKGTGSGNTGQIAFNYGYELEILADAPDSSDDWPGYDADDAGTLTLTFQAEGYTDSTIKITFND